MARVGILAVATRKNGGSLQYTLAMIEALKTLSDHHALTLYTGGDNTCFDGLALPVERLPGLAIAGIGALSRFMEVGPGLFAGEDVVIAPVYSPYLLASRPPFVFTLHDLQERHFPENFDLRRRLWRRVVNRWLVREAGRIICESEFVAGDIVRELGVDRERIAVIPAPPMSVFQEIRLDSAELEVTRQRLGLPKQYLFYPAQFWIHKNHRRLIEAFQEVARSHPDLKLVLTGHKREEHQRVFALIRDLGLADRVVHLPSVSDGDMPAVYKLSTVVVIPTLFESISLPMYEAFAVGVPVCASNVTGLPEQAGDAALLFDPVDTAGMAACFRRMLDDPSLREELIARGKRRLDAMSPRSYAERLDRVLVSIMSERDQ